MVASSSPVFVRFTEVIMRCLGALVRSSYHRLATPKCLLLDSNTDLLFSSDISRYFCQCILGTW